MIKVLLVDDDALVRSALALMLGGAPDISLVGQASDGREALALVGTAKPDVVLMDIRMPIMNGLDATKEMHSRPNPPRVIVLTTFDADDYVISAIASGADGFLLKDTPPAEIVDAIRKVSAGEPMLSPTAAATLIRKVRDDRGDNRADVAAERLKVLTQRELEVAVAVARGLSNADISAELYMSVPTVKAHISRLFDKLGATNRVQIAICVHDGGLV